VRNKWLWGCGIGCGVIIVLLGLAGIGVAGFGFKAKEKAMSALTGELRSQFDKRKSEGKIKPELQEPTSELITLVQRPETPMVAAMTVVGLLAYVFENDSVSADRTLPLITDLRDLLKANPTPNLEQINVIHEKHKALIDALEKGSDRKTEDKPTPPV
jgi:hypothetical protein